MCGWATLASISEGPVVVSTGPEVAGMSAKADCVAYSSTSGACSSRGFGVGECGGVHGLHAGARIVEHVLDRVGHGLRQCGFGEFLAVRAVAGFELHGQLGDVGFVVTGGVQGGADTDEQRKVHCRRNADGRGDVAIAGGQRGPKRSRRPAKPVRNVPVCGGKRG
jgi:hypothetical protein